MTTKQLRSDSETCVEIRALETRFGRTEALRGVDLTLETGLIYALLGPNGAGKTTLIQNLLGLVPFRRGSGRVLGRPLGKLRSLDFRRVGYVDTDSRWPRRATLQNLVSDLAPLYPSWDSDLFQDLCRRFDLDLGRPVRKLSRGQQMRSRLVLGVSHRPSLLVMDEPFGGLDPLVRGDVIDAILELTSQQRWTILLATHEVGIVERLADRVGFLDQGRMLLEADLDRLLNEARRVQVVLCEPVPPESDRPASWRQVEADGRRLRFVDLDCGADRAEDVRQRYETFLPPIETVETTCLSLEQIFEAIHGPATSRSQA